jgi:hypothetical protein
LVDSGFFENLCHPSHSQIVLGQKHLGILGFLVTNLIANLSVV